MQVESAPANRILPAARPDFIAGDGGALFVWHHPPPLEIRRGGAIVVCPPIGYEYMSAYRTLKILAERLAALGFDVLRIDYHGTGNSSGDHEQPARTDAWRQSIVHAIAE